MLSIYIHIPYCKKACYYCDFHFSAYLKNKDSFLKALQWEIVSASEQFKNSRVQTIYFGGGTPSVLSYEEITSLFDILYKHYQINTDVEISFEANPDDLTPEYLKQLKSTPVNRLSIGVQSLNPEILTFLNRRHNQNQAIECIQLAQDKGFENLTVDMIYGIPGLKISDIEDFLNFTFLCNIPHLSAYHLGIEEKTVFYRFLQQKKIHPIDEDESLKQFSFITGLLQENGFEHYEISNFCKNQQYSRHNLSYWQQKEYIGFGPSAHSYFNGKRYWNIRNNKKYIDNILLGNYHLNYEEEQIDSLTKFNDYLITSLRTKWGLDLVYTEKTFGNSVSKYLLENCQKFFQSGHLFQKGNSVMLTQKGMFISDYIFTDLIR